MISETGNAIMEYGFIISVLKIKIDGCKTIGILYASIIMV